MKETRQTLDGIETGVWKNRKPHPRNSIPSSIRRATLVIAEKIHRPINRFLSNAYRAVRQQQAIHRLRDRYCLAIDNAAKRYRIKVEDNNIELSDKVITRV